MERIPSGPGKTVANHLVPATHTLMAQAGKRNELIAPADLPDTLPDLAVLAQFMWDFGISAADLAGGGDVLHAADAHAAASCDERRKKQWELSSWWDFIGAEKQSEKYQKFLADGMTRTLVAAQAKKMSARTGGLITWQIIFDMANVDEHVDRVLDGPTSEVWIDPWVDYSRRRGSDVSPQPSSDRHPLPERTHHRGRRRRGETHQGKTHRETHPANGSDRDHNVEYGPNETITANYFVAAMPVERLDPLVTPALRAAEPRLSGLKRLITRWMNGVIFYLDNDVRCSAAMPSSSTPSGR